VALGWAVAAGPLFGSGFCVICPLLWDAPLTALQRVFIGLVVGPLVAAFQGLSVATLIVAGVWMITRRRFDKV
jgi:hypothetical protein